MLEISKKLNLTPYHPFLENYPQYQHHLEGQQEPFNNSDVSFVSTIGKGQYMNSLLMLWLISIYHVVFTAIDLCQKPCVDVLYEPGKETFTIGSPEEMSQLSGCKAEEGVITLQFGQKWKYEQVLHSIQF